MREPISIVLFMPQVLRFIEFAFFQLIFFIFRSILSIKETHKGTVRHKRHNSFGFIVPEFQTTNPYKNYKDCHTDKIDTQFWADAAIVKNATNRDLILPSLLSLLKDLTSWCKGRCFSPSGKWQFPHIGWQLFPLLSFPVFRKALLVHFLKETAERSQILKSQNLTRFLSHSYPYKATSAWLPHPRVHE